MKIQQEIKSIQAKTVKKGLEYYWTYKGKIYVLIRKENEINFSLYRGAKFIGLVTSLRNGKIESIHYNKR